MGAPAPASAGKHEQDEDLGETAYTGSSEQEGEEAAVSSLEEHNGSRVAQQEEEVLRKRLESAGSTKLLDVAEEGAGQQGQ